MNIYIYRYLKNSVNIFKYIYITYTAYQQSTTRSIKKHFQTSFNFSNFYFHSHPHFFLSAFFPFPVFTGFFCHHG